MKMSEQAAHPASFRDPSGFVFRESGVYYRQVNRIYAANYDLLMDSGLYRVLTGKKLLIPHTECDGVLPMQGGEGSAAPDRYKILQPRQLPLISYPVEWAPDQLRDAALLTLQIMELAIDHGMVLKDANPQNIQFPDAAPLFIDTLSFEKYDASRPWVAYRQFCECFVFPLYIHHYLRTGTHKILSSYPEGIPAAVTAGLLPWKSRFNAGAWMHVFLQSRIKGDGASGGSTEPHGARGRRLAFSKTKLLHLLRHLRHILEGLELEGRSVSAWSNYYNETILSEAYLGAKERLFLEYTEGLDPGSVLDLGANDGHFSRLLAERTASGMDPSADSGAAMPAQFVAVDSDWQSINELYRRIRGRDAGDGLPAGRPVPIILPLCVDIANPTPAAGFRNKERANFTERVRSDMVIALALVHHLALGRNIPLRGIAGYLAELTNTWLIIEFIPLADEKARELIRNRSVWHTPYDADAFERCFGDYFQIESRSVIVGTERILYRMKKING